MLILPLLHLVHAHDLDIQVTVPGAAPVWTTLRDVQAGSERHFEFPGAGRTRYQFDAKVQEPADGYDWRITFELAEVNGRGKRSEAKVITSPTMQARTGTLARFTLGGTTQLGEDPDVVTFSGYQILWIVRPPTEQ